MWRCIRIWSQSNMSARPARPRFGWRWCRGRPRRHRISNWRPERLRPNSGGLPPVGSFIEQPAAGYAMARRLQEMTMTHDASALRIPLDGRHRQMLIGGRWVDAISGNTLETRNPATGELLATVPRTGARDIDAAVQAAADAFNGPWSRFKPYQRQQLLLRIAELFEQHWDEISLSDTLDMGLPITRTRANRQRVIGMLRYYAGMAVALHGHSIENSLPAELVSFTRKEPVGVVGAIIPWNAPAAASIWKIGPALATGCTVVLKPSEEAPLTPLLIAELMQEAGVPPGVVNVVTGTGSEAGAPLTQHPQ